MSVFELSRLGEGFGLGKSSNARILSFSQAENSKMSTLELFQLGEGLGLGESSNARILSFSQAENSKMSTFELFQARGRARPWGKFNRAHFELFGG